MNSLCLQECLSRKARKTGGWVSDLKGIAAKLGSQHLLRK